MAAELFRRFDLFQKADSNVRITTATGGAVTVVTALIALVLVLGETANYLRPSTHEWITVDRSFGQKLEINVDVLFPSTHCQYVNFDVVDMTGEEQLAIADVRKTPVLSPRAEPTTHQGCSVAGTFMVNKVEGNFHFALGEGIPGTAAGEALAADPFARTKVGAQHQHRFDLVMLRMFNSSHHIRRLSFGREYPGMPKQPLDDYRRSVQSGLGQYNYYLQVVPTTYTRLNGYEFRTMQYSFTQKAIEVESAATSFPHPGLFFYLSFSPLVVHIEEVSTPFLHFFSSLCAVVGCLWALSSFVESGLNQVCSDLLHSKQPQR